MADAPELVEGADYYWDGPYMVFTAEYLRNRGFCCQSGCRHCPYGFKKSADDSNSNSGELD